MGRRPQEARRQAPPYPACTFTGIVYRDGEKTEGETRSIEVDRRIGWSRKHDNRLVANQEDVNVKIASASTSTYNQAPHLHQLRPDPAVLRDRRRVRCWASAGRSRRPPRRTRTPRVETEKWGRTKQETILEDHVRIAYPGPIRDDAGRMIEPGHIWLIERPVATLHTITPVTQHGLWDCAEIVLDLENWTGERHGSHSAGR